MAYGTILGQTVDAFTKTQTLTSATSALFGLPSSTVPNDIFNQLSAAVLHRATNQPKYNEVTIDLSTAQVGDIINLPFNGVMTPHVVVNVGNPDTDLYDSSCNGVWLLMQNVYADEVWDSGNSNDYQLSDVKSYLSNTVLPLYSTAIQNGISQVKIPYVDGTGYNGSVASGTSGLPCKIFLLSGYEVGFSTSDNQYFPVDGAKLSYFISGMNSAAMNKRIAMLNSSAVDWWLRSPANYNNFSIHVVNSNGGNGIRDANNSFGVRPAFIMPTTFTITVYTDSYGNAYDAQEYYTKTGLYDVLNNLLLTLPGVQIATGSYVGTGKYGSSNPNSLTFEFEPKLLFITRMQGNGNFYGANSIDGNPMDCSILTTSYTAGLGFSDVSNSDFLSGYAKKTEDGKTITWYHSGSANSQANYAQYTYYYFAIG